MHVLKESFGITAPVIRSAKLTARKRTRTFAIGDVTSAVSVKRGLFEILKAGNVFRQPTVPETFWPNQNAQKTKCGTHVETFAMEHVTDRRSSARKFAPKARVHVPRSTFEMSAESVSILKSV